ncbi:MAG: fused MFS/spermidine synthase, partial [Gemmatimonadota bacterium]
AQAAIWSWGYLIFVVLTGLVALRTYRLGQAETPGSPMGAVAIGEPGSVSTSDRLAWVARAAVGSSLLLSVTMRITTDVASVPLLWIAPLALYLVTFILAFARTFRIPRSPVAAAALVGISAALGLAIVPRVWPFSLVLLVSFWTLFSGALLCHLDLARQRPNLRHLTEFYLWIAFGGVIGGALNAVVAPLVFDSVAEYPLTLGALALLLTLAPKRGGGSRAYRPHRLLQIAGMLALVLPAQYSLFGASPPLLWVAPSAAAIVVGLVISSRNGQFAVVIGTVAVLLAVGVPFTGTLAQERSFFGVTRITSNDQVIQMIHGTTAHGAQALARELRDKPLTYYYPSGPFGTLLQRASDRAHIGVIGLGVGSMAGYGQAGQRIDFHEIDPTVVRLARSHFTFLSDSKAETSIVLGDGRLTVANVPDGTFDILVVDAFTSDAIPVHLLTIEALETYLSKVRDDGLVVVHISNRHLDLRRVFRGFSDHTGRPVAYALYEPTETERREYASTTWAVAIAPSAEGLRELLQLPGWRPLPPEVPSVLWTDDFSSIVRVLGRP